MVAVRRLIALGTVLLATLWATAAAACPVCASREEATSLRWVALGAFIISPWIVAAVVALYIRKGTLAEKGEAPLPTENME